MCAKQFEQGSISDVEPIYPNPFNPNTTLTIVVPGAAGDRLTLCSTAGERIATLAGPHSVIMRSLLVLNSESAFQRGNVFSVPSL